MSFFTTEVLLLINGVFVAILAYQGFRFLKSRKQTKFKGDLWEQEKTDPRIMSHEELEITIDNIAIGEHSPRRKEKPSSPPKPKRKHPNFSGLPHQILALPADPTKQEVIGAHKYWIRQYHPDRVQHLGPGYVKQATQRSVQLNNAKNILLKGKLTP